jgi:hypothetical protein
VNSPKFVCPRCSQQVILKIAIEQMFGDFQLDLRDQKVEPILRSLTARDPKMKLDGYFCQSCRRDIEPENLLLFDTNEKPKVGARKPKFTNPDLAVNFILLSFKMARGKTYNYFVHKDNEKSKNRIKKYMKENKAKFLGEIPFKLNTRKKVLT